MSLAMISPMRDELPSHTQEKVKAATAPVLQLVDVRKVFGDFAAVDSISVDVREGEFVTIVGPSGSGKTTLLRMLAGMETPSQGYITLRGELINDVPPDRRPTCLVFQSLALFPRPLSTKDRYGRFDGDAAILASAHLTAGSGAEHLE